MTAPAPSVIEGEIETSCDECGEIFTGPAGGKGSAPMLLGRHRWSVHKIRKDGTRGGPAKSAPADEAPAGLLTVVADAGSAVKGSAAPRADQLTKALGKILATVTDTAAGWAVKSDPAIKAALQATDPEALTFAQQQATAIAASMALSEPTAVRVAAPLGRLLAPTQLNQRFGRAVVDNTDLGPAVAEMMEVGQAWARFLAVRREHVRELRLLNQQLAAQQQAMTAPAGPPAFDGSAPLAPPPAPVSDLDPALGAGVIATPNYRTA